MLYLKVTIEFKNILFLNNYSYDDFAFFTISLKEFEEYIINIIENYLKIKSMLSNCTANKYESTKKFVNVLDLLIGHDDKNLYGLAPPEKIY